MRENHMITTKINDPYPTFSLSLHFSQYLPVECELEGQGVALILFLNSITYKQHHANIVFGLCRMHPTPMKIYMVKKQ